MYKLRIEDYLHPPLFDQTCLLDGQPNLVELGLRCNTRKMDDGQTDKQKPLSTADDPTALTSQQKAARSKS
jgi:hypothetical protein